jgi:hypothetical protein
VIGLRVPGRGTFFTQCEIIFTIHRSHLCSILPGNTRILRHSRIYSLALSLVIVESAQVKLIDEVVQGVCSK